MCGRVVQRDGPKIYAEKLRITNSLALPNAPARYNLAPTQPAITCRWNAETKSRQLDLLSFGLIPTWAKDRKIATSGINARSETIAEKPMFRAAFTKRRAVVPVDAYFEWQQIDPKTKQPFAFVRRDGEPMFLAALWENWRDVSSNEWIRSFCLITTTPNDIAAEIHDRMPVILSVDDIALWLGETEGDYHALLRPAPNEWLRAYPVDRRVGNVRNDDAQLLEPISA